MKRSKKWDNEKINKSFKKEKCKVINIKKIVYDYGTTQTEVEYVCSKGHKNKVRLSNWKRGTRCSKCKGIQFSKKYIINSFSLEGYKVVNIKITKSGQIIKYLCPNKKHGINKIYWSKWKSGIRCSFCSGNIMFFRDMLKLFEKEGYTVITSENVFNSNRKVKIKYLCSKGHKGSITTGNWKLGRRCKTCSLNKQTSFDEREILSLVKNLVKRKLKIINNCRSVIINPLTGYNLELDIWIPELKKAIEYNGKYWHSSEEVKIRDSIKIKQCKEKNIDLLVINERDWVDYKEKVINKIKRFIINEI